MDVHPSSGGLCWGLANVVFLTVAVRLPNLALGYSPVVYPKRFLDVLYTHYN